MANVEPLRSDPAPVRHSVIVEIPPDEAFQLFTAGIASWWPRRTHSVSQERATDVILEPRVGGSLFEVREDGATFPWGKVIAWSPPARLVLSWHPGREPEVAQEVEVRFTAADGGTRVDLEHRNWSRLGEKAAEVRDLYAGGWAGVLDTHFAGACASSRTGKEKR